MVCAIIGVVACSTDEDSDNSSMLLTIFNQQKELKQSNTQRKLLEQSQTELSAKIATLEAQITSDSNQKDEKLQELANLRQQKEQIEIQLNNINASVIEKDNTITELKEQNENDKNAIAQFTTQIEQDKMTIAEQGALVNEQTLILDAQKSGLPIVSIKTENNKEIISKTDYLKASISTIDLDDTKNIFIANVIMDNIRCRGNSSYGLEKLSYTIKLDKKMNLLGIATGEHKQYALIANHYDKTLVRNQFVYTLGQEVYNNMAFTPHCKQVNLFINDKYMGVYLLCERIKINKKLVNVKDVSECPSFDKGGWIVEVNGYQDEIYNWLTPRGVSFSLKDPDDYSGWEQIKDYINNVEDVLFNDDIWLDKNKGYSKYLDIDSFIDWYIIEELTKNTDCWWSSVFMYFDSKDNKLHMGPLWDFDVALGNCGYNDSLLPEGFWVKGALWFARLFNDDSFDIKVKERWNEKKITIR